MEFERSLRTTFSHWPACSSGCDAVAGSSVNPAAFTFSLWQLMQYLWRTSAGGFAAGAVAASAAQSHGITRYLAEVTIEIWLYYNVVFRTGVRYSHADA